MNFHPVSKSNQANYQGASEGRKDRKKERKKERKERKKEIGELRKEELSYGVNALAYLRPFVTFSNLSFVFL